MPPQQYRQGRTERDIMMGDRISCVTRVRVRDLPLLADVGINPDEIGRRQPLVISVELLLDGDCAGSIDQTIDYRRIAAAAEALAALHIPLIETFAARLGAEMVGWPMVEEARVSIDKPFALTRGLAGTEVVVRRPAQQTEPPR